jgi:hypothetical protein
MNNVVNAFKRFQEADPLSNARQAAWYDYCDARDGLPSGTSEKLYHKRTSTVHDSEGTKDLVRRYYAGESLVPQ